MNNTQSDQTGESEGPILSTEELQQRVEENYISIEPEEERWFRCQREIAGTTCDTKVFFPTGVRAHENHHSIEAGNGPLIVKNYPSTSESEDTESDDTNPDVADKEVLDEIGSEFNGLESK